MRIQVTEAMFIKLRSSRLAYVMKQRGEVEVKVRQSRSLPTPPAVADACVGRVISCVCRFMCLSVCPRSKSKTA